MAKVKTMELMQVKNYDNEINSALKDHGIDISQIISINYCFMGVSMGNVIIFYRSEEREILKEYPKY